MPTLGQVIPFPVRQSCDAEKSRFSAHDEILVLRLLSVLADEIASGKIDAETRMRLYFYLSMHSHVMDRWMGLLSPRSTRNQQLSEDLADTFQRVISPSALEEDPRDGESYYSTVSALSNSLWSLLELIRSS
jgi:hypothetical protein